MLDIKLLAPLLDAELLAEMRIERTLFWFACFLAELTFGNTRLAYLDHQTMLEV